MENKKINRPLMIYFAGGLFDHKELVGNALLSEMIEKLSNNKYKCHLPQNKENTIDRGVKVRNKDIEKLMKCDLGLFNFDGTDLDSGTVVEYCFAKFLDIPSILFRTDFRFAGDQKDGGDPWNLMCAGFPRTKKVLFHSMLLFQDMRHKYQNLSEQLNEFHKIMALEIIKNLDEVIKMKSNFNGDKEKAKNVYLWCRTSAGGEEINQNITDEYINNIIDSKYEAGLI